MMKMGVIVMWAMVAALVICAALWPLARHADRRGCPGLLHNAALRLRQLTLSALLALGAVSICAVAHSGKMRRPATGGTPVVPVTVTPQDLTNGWRVAEETESEPFAQPSANAVTNKRWRLRGAHDDAFRIFADGWSYPYATGITVLSRGELRTNIRMHDFPRTFDHDLTLLPIVNWPLLPEGRRESFFWHDATPFNTLLVTWRNAALGRDATNPVNFQAEFYPDGGFTYRYEDRTVRHVRVWPFDWDDDGLENSVDPDPLTAGSDAHGTNAKWYNVVCPNIVNPNAYYFVDVVATQGPAPIYFIGDRDSRLGNPVVVTYAGVTNHVPLLMGVEYAVTSPVPFEVSVPENAVESRVGAHDGRAYSVRWPLSFGLAVTSDGGYEVEVQPFDPSGEFTWKLTSQGGGLRGAPHRAVGCHYTSVSNWIGFACGTGGNCGCNGCSVDGMYSIEGALFVLPSIWCGCSSHEEYPAGTNEVPSEVSVSVAFDKPVVFYENAYTNAPSEEVAKRSTRTTLTIAAYGGNAGGRLDVLAQNIGKLVCTGGHAAVFPYGAIVPPHGTMSLSVEYEADQHSGASDDISVAASIISLDGGSSAMASDTATAAEILIEAKVDFPSGFRTRHVYGVAELVECTVQPSLPNVVWVSSGMNQQTITSACWEYELPSSPSTVTLNVGCSGVTLPITMTCIAPTGYFVPRNPDVVIAPNVQVGDSGGFGMCIDLGIMPTNVCFSRIQVVEGVSSNDVHTGYYADKTNDWHHGTAEGAWKEWVSVSTSNNAAQDMVTSVTNAPPWQSGVLCWQIPNYWRTVSDPTTNYFCTTPQTFTMSDNGTQSISKFDWIVVRPTNTVSQIQYGKIRR